MATYPGIQAHKSGQPWVLDVDGDGAASLVLSVPHGVAVHHIYIDVASGQGGSCQVTVADQVTGYIFAQTTGEVGVDIFCSADRTDAAGTALDAGVSVTDPTIGRRNLTVTVASGAEANEAITVIIDTVDTE